MVEQLNLTIELFQFLGIKLHLRLVIVMLLQADGFQGQKEAIRLDLTEHGLQVKKVKVGPFNLGLFDSGVAVSSGTRSASPILFSWRKDFYFFYVLYLKL